ncbi:hypothetical protein ELE36_06925 [Pseudolysobacter antarcticus]|uniref:Uncharacterized protein n=1 Tax=Pseudolysobacter antarcticus TaxID=2511995 RepID=A0A411HI98_9GAMM|nr:hypothetical protein [Pseudolysobacter antarcticus]QBB70120.1 hypothetical protein ELE36_06925 [Pseudolysobacter antarcticus]
MEFDVTHFALRHSQPAAIQTSNISRLRKFSLKAIVGLLMFLSVLAAHAEARLEVFRESPQFVGLTLGQSGSMAIAIRNHGPDTAAYVQIGTLTIGGAVSLSTRAMK